MKKRLYLLLAIGLVVSTAFMAGSRGIGPQIP